MIEVKVKYGQTLVDVALEQYGCEEGIITLAADNALAIDAELTPGQILLLQSTLPVISVNNQTIATYFKTNKVGINSGIEPIESVTPEDGFYSDDFYDTEFYD